MSIERQDAEAMRVRQRTRPRIGSTRREAHLRRKGVLFCPGCDHESHVDGDWLRSESGGRTRYTCPTCGAVVVSQPALSHPNAA